MPTCSFRRSDKGLIFFSTLSLQPLSGALLLTLLGGFLHQTSAAQGFMQSRIRYW